MKMLIVCQYFWPEEFLVNDFAVGLRKRGHEVEVLTGLPNYPSGIFFEGYGWNGPFRDCWNGISVRRVPIIPRGYSEAYWSGVTTIELAKALVEFIRQDITGIYQFTVEPKISKYDLLALFKKAWARDTVTVNENPDYFCDKSMLSDRHDFQWAMSTHTEMVNEMKQWVQNHQNEHAHYRPQ
jgi:hypothetical protein